MTTRTFERTEPVPPSATDARIAEESARLLAPTLKTANRVVQLRVGDDNSTSEPVAIPTEAFRLLVNILAQMASGNAVQLVPQQAELTTQEAARLLNMSRPYVVRLLDEGRIPSHRTGTHRRVMLRDVLTFKAEHRRARSAALDRLSDLDQELGLI